MLAVSSSRACSRQSMMSSVAVAHPCSHSMGRVVIPRTPSRSTCFGPLLPALHGPASSSGRIAPRQVVQLSFLGVGAPEAVLVGVVALVVFGPKGLAEAAKSVGGLMRSFSPTIREVVEVGRDLQGSLQKELGLNEIRDEFSRPAAQPRPSTFEPPSPAASSSREDPDIEAMRARSAEAAWSSTSSSSSSSGSSPGPSASAGGDAARPERPLTPFVSPAASQDLGSLSMEELEAELMRRRTAGSGGAAGRSASPDATKSA